MGILNKKQRVFDTIITSEGKRQLAQGTLRFEFVSFTDGDAFYEGDAIEGSADASDKVYFEASSLPYDTITIESDDTGHLSSFPATPFSIIDGKFVSSSYVSAADELAEDFVTVLSSSIDAFSKHNIIRSRDQFTDDSRQFEVSNNDLQFTVNDAVPFKKYEATNISVEKHDALFIDKKLSNTLKFRHLPPLNRQTINGVTPIGTYQNLGNRTESLEIVDIEKSIEKKEKQVVQFLQTSTTNDLFCQLFELQGNTVSKLDIVDAGLFSSVVNGSSINKHVFFAGKVYVDSRGLQKFFNVFTLIFEE